MDQPTYSGFVVQALFYLAIFVFSGWYVFKYAKPSSRQKKFLAGTSVVFTPIILILFLGPTMAFSSAALIACVITLAISCMVAGLTAIFYANDAVKLWKSSRRKGKAGAWAVPYLPQKQFFIINGSLMFFTGAFIMVMMLVSPPK